MSSSGWAGLTGATCGSTTAGGRGRCRQKTQRCGGIGRSRAGRHSGHGQPQCVGAATGDPQHPPRIRYRRRPGWCWLRRKPRTPGGNATGFTPFEYGISAKWLELLKQIAPKVTRAAVLRDPTSAAGIGLFGAMQGVAPSLGVNLHPIGIRDPGEIERGIVAFAREPNGALIITTSALTSAHQSLLVTLAARHRLPAIYPYRFFVTGGGLISYGSDQIDEVRRAAGYLDRILKGEKPADLPVQAPIKYELVINLKTAKALGIDVPPTLLARADEVIE